MEEKNIAASAVTKEMIAEWKKKHGDVFKIKVEEKEAYLKRPDRKTLAYASSVVSSNPIKFSEILLNGCWLAGDEEIKTQDSLFLSASGKLGELIEVKESELVKL
jgi:hypothetical protein